MRLTVLAASIAVLLVGVGASPARSTQAAEATQGRWVITDLGTLGGPSSHASAINNRGQIVGSAETKNGDWHAVLWQQGKMRDLGTLPGFRNSASTDINERGQVVGEGTNYRADGSTVSYHAFLWQDGRMTDLGTLGGRKSEAGKVQLLTEAGFRPASVQLGPVGSAETGTTSGTTFRCLSSW